MHRPTRNDNRKKPVPPQGRFSGEFSWRMAVEFVGMPQRKKPMSEAKTWYYAADGQKAGPVTLEEMRRLKQSGAIRPDTLVWTTGMDGWTPASGVAELTAPPVNLGTDAPKKPTVPSHPATPDAGADPEPNPYAPPQALPKTQTDLLRSHVHDDDYPIPHVERTNFTLYLVPFLLGFALLFGGAFMMESKHFGHSSPGILMLILGGLSLLFGVIVGLVYLHRAWTLLQPGGAATTPGKAVGFLFIPLFTIYWRFIAYWKWSQDWNRITASYRNLAGAPRASEGLCLTYAILGAVTAFINYAGIVELILALIVMKHICNSVNFMCDVREARSSLSRGEGLGPESRNPMERLR